MYIQNIGFLTATYEVSVSHCSSGIDWISAQILTLDPGEQTNVSFVVHSFNSMGQINNCESNDCNAINFDYNIVYVHVFVATFSFFFLVQLLDQSAELLDNLTILFETLDTCFCYGYCGCSVNNKSFISYI